MPQCDLCGETDQRLQSLQGVCELRPHPPTDELEGQEPPGCIRKSVD